MSAQPQYSSNFDSFTTELFQTIFSGERAASTEEKQRFADLYQEAAKAESTGSLCTFFQELYRLEDVSAESLGFTVPQLTELALKHSALDEHGVTIGGRVSRARPIVETANSRVADYLQRRPTEAPSGIELWETIAANGERIKSTLKMSDESWNSYGGQLKYAINDVETLARCLELPSSAIEDVLRVTNKYRMRLTPYYASLIIPGAKNDPVLLQSVPTGEMIDNVGVEIPPVASDHSPARLIDQFYPRVCTIKVTNICAMYCTHCLRLAHIGKNDHIFPKAAYKEAIDYIRNNEFIRDVLITGGDSFVLPNATLRWLLEELDSIDHLESKRLGTRIPVTAPQRIDAELLDILEESNDRGPVRVVTQINTAQEITPVSKEAFKQISKRVSGVMNQAVLLRGINDSKVKMWSLCETIHAAYVRPYYVFNCSFRNPEFAHMRVPVEVGRDIIEGMYGNIQGDAIPRYIATAGGKIPLHRSNVMDIRDGKVILRKPWSGEIAEYPDANIEEYYNDKRFAFNKYE